MGISTCMAFHEHHFRNLGRARDHLTETIVSLQSATERMTGDDWIDATTLLNEITEDIGPRLARLRTAASERFDDHSRTATSTRCAPASCRSQTSASPLAPPPAAPRRARSSSRRRNWRPPTPSAGAALVAKHGGVEPGDDGLPARQPRVRRHPGVPLRQHGQRPQGWIPPIV